MDATILHAASSTKNKLRDPGDAPGEKSNQWYLGMKAHVGVDAGTKLIHSMVATTPVRLCLATGHLARPPTPR